EAEIAAFSLHLRFVQAERGMQVGEIGVKSSGVQSAGADVRPSPRVGGDRHGVTLRLSEGRAKSILDRLVNRSRHARRLSSPGQAARVSSSSVGLADRKAPARRREGRPLLFRFLWTE